MLGAVVTLYTLILMFQQANTQTSVDWKTIDRVLGRSGNLQGETYRVAFPRNDLHVTVGAVTIRPSLALGSWVAFKQTGDSTAMLMGDLVLLPVERGHQRRQRAPLHRSDSIRFRLHRCSARTASPMAGSIRSVSPVPAR